MLPEYLDNLSSAVCLTLDQVEALFSVTRWCLEGLLKNCADSLFTLVKEAIMLGNEAMMLGLE